MMSEMPDGALVPARIRGDAPPAALSMRERWHAGLPTTTPRGLAVPAKDSRVWSPGKECVAVIVDWGGYEAATLHTVDGSAVWIEPLPLDALADRA